MEHQRLLKRISSLRLESLKSRYTQKPRCCFDSGCMSFPKRFRANVLEERLWPSRTLPGSGQAYCSCPFLCSALNARPRAASEMADLKFLEPSIRQYKPLSIAHPLLDQASHWNESDCGQDHLFQVEHDPLSPHPYRDPHLPLCKSPRS